MTPDTSAVLAKADELGDSLLLAKNEMDPAAYLDLLNECNGIIRRMTRIEYSTVCAPVSGGCNCGGTC